MKDFFTKIKIKSSDFDKGSFRFDFFNINYEKLFVLNQVFLWIYYNQHNEDGRSKYRLFYDGDICIPLACKIYGTQYKFEFCNRYNHDFKDPTKAFLKCNITELKDTSDTIENINYFKKQILDIPNGFYEFVEKANKKSYEMFMEDLKNGIKPNPELFLSKNRKYICTIQHVLYVYSVIFKRSNPDILARKFCEENKINLITKQDLINYCNLLVLAINKYLENKN